MITIDNKFSKSQKLKGYNIKNNQITFIFDQNLYHNSKLKKTTVSQVSIIGSFTNWKTSWDLTKNNKLWTLTLTLNKINIPGNCGYPEFRFVINNELLLDAAQNLSLNHKFYDDHGQGYKNIILSSNSNSAKIKTINKRIENYKSNYSSPEELANFREVKLGKINTNTIYRSYHPFKKSRPQHPLEEKRITTVQKLIKKNKINSIINLSDTNTTIPPEVKYYKKLAQQQNVIFTNKNYNYDVFYYIADSKEFAQLLTKIIKFIINKDSPYLIHCRIGTDRTGIIIAILAAFMGANWQEIITEYQLSNNLGIGEYRSEKLLQYFFQQLLEEPNLVDDLDYKINNYLKKKTNLSATDLNTLYNKLKA